MNNHLLQSVACPSCGAPIDLRAQSTGDAYVHCDACGNQFILKGHVCPHCGTYYEQEVDFCRQCGANLTRRCPQCNTINWIGDEYCVNCGTPLDILELIVQRHNQDTESRLYRQMGEGQKLKEAELAASQTRYTRLLEQERAEQAALRRRILEQKRQERKALTIVLSIAGVLLVAIITAMLITAL